MRNYRRAFRPGGTFFFTLVTYGRRRFLCDDLARTLLREAIDACRVAKPFTIEGFVLLPDHLHALWTLPPGDADFSSRWMRIKRRFTRGWIAAGAWEGAVSDSRRRNRRRGVWQRRFWEHVIRDRDDFERHLNYIHYNPVKHHMATCPHAWPWSSFHRLVQNRVYRPAWCCGCDGDAVIQPDFQGLDAKGIEQEYGE